MAATFQLEIATPERLIFRGQASEAQIPGLAGYFGVLPQHAPLLSLLGSGVLEFTDEAGKSSVMAVSGGFVEVLPEQVRVLATNAEHASEIKIDEARQRLQQIQQQQAGAQPNDPSAGIDIAGALEQVAHAQARVDAAQKTSTRQ